LEEREAICDQLFESMEDGYGVIEFFDGRHGPLSDYSHVLANAGYEKHAGSLPLPAARRSIPAQWS
jgi:hypothetical protein